MRGVMTRLHDGDLLAYIDGQADAQTAALIEDSPETMDRVREIKRLQARLSARLYRAECPETLVLGEYYQGLLHPDRASMVQRHLALCPYCRKEYARLQEFFEPPPGLMERARKVAASLVSTGQLALQLRGGEAPLLYVTENVQIALNIKADIRRPERKSLAGLVVGRQADGWIVLLLKGGERIGAAPVDEMGNFLFAGLNAGDYELHIYTADEDIAISPLRVIN